MVRPYGASHVLSSSKHEVMEEESRLLTVSPAYFKIKKKVSEKVFHD